MTTAQTMLGRAGALALLGLALGAGFGWWGGLGCAARGGERLVEPSLLVAPYGTEDGDVLWGVAPLRNESGTTLADPYIVSDKIAAAASQVRGVTALPLNRTLTAMRSLDMSELESPEDVMRLAEAMGVDALVVGSITAYDPYSPPTLGVALALYARPGALSRGGGAGIDTRALRYQPTEYTYFPRSRFAGAPASVVSEHLDAKNHRVLMDLQEYARGRHEGVSALGWRRYMASMDLYSEFAAWHAVGRLLDHERVRLAGPATAAAGAQ